jgi:tetratricopeptide (TPR) repeat protein
MKQIDVEKVERYIEEEKYEKALQLLQTLEKEAPLDGEVYYQYGCMYDGLGKEETAIPYYEKALVLGLQEKDLRLAYIQLGSSYRCVGKYEKAKAVLKDGLVAFPEDEAMLTFLAMTEHNLQNYEKAMGILLKLLVHHTSSPHLQSYKRAISFYSNHLNEVFLEER